MARFGKQGSRLGFDSSGMAANSQAETAAAIVPTVMLRQRLIASKRIAAHHSAPVALPSPGSLAVDGLVASDEPKWDLTGLNPRRPRRHRFFAGESAIDAGQ